METMESVRGKISFPSLFSPLSERDLSLLVIHSGASQLIGKRRIDLSFLNIISLTMGEHQSYAIRRVSMLCMLIQQFY